MGKIPFYVEFREFPKLKRKYVSLNKEMNNLAADETGRLIPNFLRKAWELKRKERTKMSIEELAAFLAIDKGDKNLALELGAFAYLQKPLDINVLSETIRKANEKIRQKKRGRD